MPDPGPEHRIYFDNEFTASQEADTDWAGYLAIESALAKELEQEIPGDMRPQNLLDRYWPGSMTYPARFDGNWNRSYELSIPEPRGYAVLLHGLSDSPYTMLAMAQTLAGAGYDLRREVACAIFFK